MTGVQLCGLGLILVHGRSRALQFYNFILKSNDLFLFTAPEILNYEPISTATDMW